MKTVHPSDRQIAMGGLKRDEVDAEFLPYIDRINRFGFCVTGQSCVGHVKYSPEAIEAFDLAPNQTHWGYLWLLCSEEFAQWINDRAASWDWVFIELSRFWNENANEPTCTDYGTFELVFAWDFSAWPRPADDILAAVEEFDRDFNDVN